VLLNKEADGTLLFSDPSACNPENVLLWQACWIPHSLTPKSVTSADHTPVLEFYK